MRRKLFFIVLLIGLLAAVVAQPAAAQSPIWRGEYFNNATLSGTPTFTRNDPAIAFNWGLGGPGEGVGPDNFSIRWATDVFLPAGNYRFWALADDHVRVTFNFNTTVIDTFGTGRVGQLVSGDVNVPASGSYHIQVDYQELEQTAYVFVDFANLASGQTSPNFGTVGTPIIGNPWTAQYFANTTLSGDPVAILTEPSPNHNWGTGQPLPTVPADNFSVRWTSVQFLEGGNYRIETRADDGVRVFVNGVLVINEFGPASGRTFTADLTLPAGPNNFQVEFVEFGGEAFIEFSLTRQGVAPAPTPIPGQPTGATAQVTAFRLNVRDLPTVTGSQVITRVNRFETYPVLGRTADSAWYFIQVGEQRGWVSARFVNIINGANIPVVDERGGSIVATPTGPRVTATPYTVVIRSGPGTEFNRLGTLPAGQSAQVIGRNANNTWWQINFNGIIGWSSAQFAIIQQGVDVNAIPITG
ncbi:MAG: PA14 domain-containing protein [Aggregatilineales bacterium]